jgi:pyrroline-5-carboxylate reductase
MSTSISGSGPAYVFLLMEAMIDAGVHMGFSRETATTLCHQTIIGTTQYAIQTKQHPAILRNMVTSPAGTTASAIYELENGKFRTVIKDVSTIHMHLVSSSCFGKQVSIHSLYMFIYFSGNVGVLSPFSRNGRKTQ